MQCFTWQWRSAAGCRQDEAPWAVRVPSAEGRTCPISCYWSHRAPPGCWSRPLIGWLQEGSRAYWPIHLGTASCEGIPTENTNLTHEQRAWKISKRLIKINKKNKWERERKRKWMLSCAPLCFDEKVVRELRQIVVLEVQDLELWPLQPLSQPAHFIPACQQFSQAPTGQQPTTQTVQWDQSLCVL